MLHIVDYTGVAAELLDRPTAPKHHGKAVLIRSLNEYWFVMAPMDFCSLHAQIVSRFCELRKLRTVQLATRVEPASDQWQVLGGCHYEVDQVEKSMTFYGYSEAYGAIQLTDSLRSDLLECQQFAQLAVRFV